MFSSRMSRQILIPTLHPTTLTPTLTVALPLTLTLNLTRTRVQCAGNPVPIGVGYLCQYLIKPMLGFIIAKVRCPPPVIGSHPTPEHCRPACLRRRRNLASCVSNMQDVQC